MIFGATAPGTVMPGLNPVVGTIAPAPAGSASHNQLIKQAMEILVMVIRGDEGLNIPAAAKAQLQAIAASAVKKLDAGIYPALTSGDLQTIFNLTSKQLPWWTRLFSAR